MNPVIIFCVIGAALAGERYQYQRWVGDNYRDVMDKEVLLNSGVPTIYKAFPQLKVDQYLAAPQLKNEYLIQNVVKTVPIYKGLKNDRNFVGDYVFFRGLPHGYRMENQLGYPINLEQTVYESPRSQLGYPINHGLQKTVYESPISQYRMKSQLGYPILEQTVYESPISQYRMDTQLGYQGLHKNVFESSMNQYRTESQLNSYPVYQKIPIKGLTQLNYRTAEINPIYQAFPHLKADYQVYKTQPQTVYDYPISGYQGSNGLVQGESFPVVYQLREL